MNRSILVALPLLLLAAPASAGAGGSIVVRKNLAELAREAERIVVGRVVAARAAWNAERTLIWTAAEVAVQASWKGEPVARLDVVEPGGVVGGVAMGVPGAPRYAPGDRVLAFLKRDALGQWRTLGWTQGRFALREVDGEGPVILPGPPHVIAGHFADVPEGCAVPLGVFEARVRALLAGREEGAGR